MDGAGMGGKEARKGRFGEQRETEKQKDVWSQTQAAMGEGKCKGEDQSTKNWGLKSLKEGRETVTEGRWRSAVVKSEKLKRTG